MAKIENIPKRGDKFRRCGNDGRVMAVADGWVMARLKGCVPFVMSVKEFYSECFSIPEAKMSNPFYSGD